MSDGRLGRPRVHLRVTDSTNERARELAAGGAPHGTLVTAAEQSAGRGRQGRRWSAPAGTALLMSLVVHEPPPLLPLMSAIAVADACGDGALIKWPNDIVVASAPDEELAKLAGILIEARPQAGWAVVGIGLNVAVALGDLPPELRPGAAAAGIEGARPAATLGRSREQIEPTLQALLETLERWLAADELETLEAWREWDALLGRPVAWDGGEGTAAGIDGLGRLVVQLAAGGQTALGSGEVHLSRIGS